MNQLVFKLVKIYGLLEQIKCFIIKFSIVLEEFRLIKLK